MAYVNTDSTYYGANAREVRVTANGVPFDPQKFEYATVALVHDSTNRTIVLNRVVELKGKPTLVNPIPILSSDPRGTYYVLVIWYDKNANEMTRAKSSFIYLT
ncbi:hypothetical protein SAMN05428961_11465 [Paenibacillus sp. OK060]|uniref:hypothetical protein n=1 Tax=Paenibacillus sp. OK060 TaxID=1881034 RepID=UPI000887CC60|nr:hypothetical protein [Paenibacillus sp. OK060]SDM34059.1 hypothetical protein SAMN05428961_11465 [Paenibacillus sp. OK060]